MPRDFWFGGFRYQDDRFSGFRYQATIAVGIGHRFIDSDRTKLNGDSSAWVTRPRRPATRSIRLRSCWFPVRRTTRSRQSAVLTGSTRSATSTKVYNNFAFEAARQNNFVRNEVGVSVAMTSRLALAVAYTVRYNTDPPVGYDKTETLLTVNIVYEVK